MRTNMHLVAHTNVRRFQTIKNLTSSHNCENESPSIQKNNLGEIKPCRSRCNYFARSIRSRHSA